MTADHYRFPLGPSGYLRQLIRQSPFLYRLYLTVMGVRQRSVFPNRQTDLHLTGFPRSANTFATRLVQQAAPSIRLSTHIHAVASLQLALRFSVPIIVLIREPTAAISSGILRSGVQPGPSVALTRWLADYSNYYRFVARHLDAVRLCRFETVTQTPHVFLEHLAGVFPDAVIVPRTDMKDFSEEVLRGMRERNRRRLSSRSSVPNQDKDRNKRMHESFVREHALFPDAETLYADLLSNPAIW